MPFTFSHAAVASPINRLIGQQLPLLALAVGTLSPDLEFFLRGRIERTIGHTVHGVVLLDVPLSLALLATLTWLVVPAVVVLLPDSALHYGRPLERTFALPNSAWTDRRALLKVVLAITIGAGSHLLWDRFTHRPEPDETALGWLNWLPFSIGQADFALHSILQWISTAVGLAVVLASFGRWLDNQPREIPAEALLNPTPIVIRRLGWGFVAVTTVAFAIQNPFAILGDGGARPSGLANVLAHSAIWAPTGAFVALCLFGVAVQAGLIHRRRDRPPGHVAKMHGR